MKNKKGFTLVELMAVVIILIIIVFIAINKVNKSTKDARDKTIVANAGLYVKAVNGFISEKTINDDNYESGKLTVSQLDSEGVTISGTKPDSGYVVFSNSEVKYACFIYSGYNITYDDGDFSDITRDECEDLPISYNFTYKNKEEVFTVPFSGEYILEVWGGQGGSYSNTTGGYGGYSRGTITLKKGDKLYINVAGKGSNCVYSGTVAGGYNGGGMGHSYNNSICATSGGGATHIATQSGLLASLSSSQSSVLIVAGGGSGAYGWTSSVWSGNSGGGTSGSGSYGGTQTSGYSFGQSNQSTEFESTTNYSGGGGGWYGGSPRWDGGAGGGSGYIGNEKLTDKDMYCYNCTTSNIESTNTISVNCAESDPTPECAKKDSGYARITYNINDLYPTDNLADYQFVEYIESSGTQYIATDIVPTNQYGVLAKVSFTSSSTSGCIFGSMGNGNSRMYSSFENNLVNYGWNNWNETSTLVSASCPGICDIKLNYNGNNKYIFGSAEISSNLGTLNIDSNPGYAIFANNNKGNYDSFSSLKLYNVKITNGTNLVNDLVPCYHKTEGTIGLCDTISKKFYANSGTGTFIKGNDVTNN